MRPSAAYWLGRTSQCLQRTRSGLLAPCRECRPPFKEANFAAPNADSTTSQGRLASSSSASIADGKSGHPNSRSLRVLIGHPHPLLRNKNAASRRRTDQPPTLNPRRLRVLKERPHPLLGNNATTGNRHPHPLLRSEASRPAALSAAAIPDWGLLSPRCTRRSASVATSKCLNICVKGRRGPVQAALLGPLVEKPPIRSGGTTLLPSQQR
jgi:hypothetical protein